MSHQRILIQLLAVLAFVAFAVLRRSPFLQIIALCIAALVGYGIVQDQFTVRLCPEYFTRAHPTIPDYFDPDRDLEGPTLLAISWGFLGSWWGGLFMGIVVGLTARLVCAPKLGPRELAKPILVVIAVVGITALVSGLIGYGLAKAGVIWVAEDWERVIPRERHVAFLAVGWTHAGAYLAGVVASLGLCA